MADSILIVDDERGIRETLRAVIEDEGFVADAVASGEECLKALELRAYGCVLLDVWLPGIDGLETLKRLREQGTEAAVVIISGHGNIETAVRATKLGAFDFIEKPLSIEKTVLVVRNALRQRQLELINAELAANWPRNTPWLASPWRCVAATTDRCCRAHLTGASDLRGIRAPAKNWSRAPFTRSHDASTLLSSSKFCSHS